MTFAPSALQFDCANFSSFMGCGRWLSSGLLISVYDKTGIVEFAQARWRRPAWKSSRRAARPSCCATRASRFATSPNLTGWPEMLGGRVKTLHPESAWRNLVPPRIGPTTRDETRKQGIAADRSGGGESLSRSKPPRREPDLTAEELIENIDIGGPAMVRSAAKNFESVAVVTDPSDYAEPAGGIWTNGGDWTLATRLALARKAFAMTARYDGMIATELERLQASGRYRDLAERPDFPAQLHFALSRHAALRYGENPHQKAAALYSQRRARSGLAGARQLQGKELSYNNLVDLDAAWSTGAGIHRPRRHREAQQSLRHGRTGHARRSLSAGAGVRSGLGIWRRDGLQSPARRARRPRKWPSFSWNASSRRDTTRRRAKRWRARKICGCWRWSHGCRRKGAPWT